MSNMLRKIERQQFRLKYGSKMGSAWAKRASERRDAVNKEFFLPRLRALIAGWKR